MIKIPCTSTLYRLCSSEPVLSACWKLLKVMKYLKQACFCSSMYTLTPTRRHTDRHTYSAPPPLGNFWLFSRLNKMHSILHSIPSSRVISLIESCLQAATGQIIDQLRCMKSHQSLSHVLSS